MNDELIPILDNKTESKIKSLIYTFRDKQVMLDSDIAQLFNVETGNLNKAMTRNINRFPEDFCFKLNSLEFQSLNFQNGISNKGRGGRRKLPFVYTEQGIIALAGVLKSEVADQMCVRISRVFVKMRQAVTMYAEPLKYISKIHGEVIDLKEFTFKTFDEVFTRLEKLEPKREVLLLDDEWFDAYEAIIKLIERAKESIVLVDPYIDDKTLVYLSHRNEGVRITLYKSNKSKLKESEVEAFSKQYGEVMVKEFNKSHNRFLILDSNEVYDLGTSLNSIGNKIFSINKLEITELADVLISKFK